MKLLAMLTISLSAIVVSNSTISFEDKNASKHRPTRLLCLWPWVITTPLDQRERIPIQAMENPVQQRTFSIENSPAREKTKEYLISLFGGRARKVFEKK